MRVITVASLDGYSRRKDKSVSLRFITQEKTSEEIKQIDELCDTFGVLYYKGESSLNKEEIADLDNVGLDLYDKKKTQSQRLRNVLYKVHEMNGGSKSGFADWYNVETEKIINHYKQKLDNE